MWVFMAVPKKNSSGSLYQIPGRTLSMSTKGLNLTYMPQGDVEQGDDAHLRAKSTENLHLACLHKGRSSMTGFVSVCEVW